MYGAILPLPVRILGVVVNKPRSVAASSYAIDSLDHPAEHEDANLQMYLPQQIRMCILLACYYKRFSFTS